MKKVLLVILSALLLTACGKKEVVIVDENGDTQTVKVEKYDGKNGTSCYDYIVETMSKPQYWDESVELPYSNAISKDIEGDPGEAARKVLVNGTAYTLTDEESAIFSRGYQSTFSLNFSEGTAETIVNKDVIPYVGDSYPEGWFYDFNNNIWEARYVHNKTVDLLENSYADIRFLPYADDEYHSSDSNYGFVKDDVLEYERKFSEAGCPLLNQPKGTLNEYKEVLAHPENVTDDGKIDGPWELEGFDWDYTNYDKLVWTDDLRAALDIELPDSGHKTEIYEAKKDANGDYIITNGELENIKMKVSADSLSFTAVVEPSNLSQYVYENSYSKLQYEDYKYRFIGATGSFAAYYLTPLTTELYGKSSVFMFDQKNLKGSVRWEDVRLNTKKYLDLSNEGIDCNESIYLIYPLESENYKVASRENGDINLIGIYNYEAFVRNAFAGFNKEYPFSDLYVFHWQLLYNMNDQRMLGLR